MRKRIVATVLALCLVLGLVPGTAWAVEMETSGKCGKNATWSFDAATETLTISGTGAMDDYSCEWYSNPPPYIGWNGYEGNYIRSVVVSEGITHIGSDAFGSFTMFGILFQLKHVKLPRTLKSIGACAFANAESLTSIVLPDGLVSIDSYAFSGTKLTSLHLPASLKEIGYEGLGSGEDISRITVASGNPQYAAVDGVLYWVNSSSWEIALYPGKNTRTEYTIPTQVSELYEGVLSNKEYLRTIAVPSTVKTIPAMAFMNCPNLSSIILPEGLISVDPSAFWWCTSLSKLEIPSSVTSFTTDIGPGDGWNGDTSNLAVYFKSSSAPKFDASISKLKYAGDESGKVMIYYPTNSSGWESVQNQEDVKLAIEEGLMEFRTWDPNPELDSQAKVVNIFPANGATDVGYTGSDQQKAFQITFDREIATKPGGWPDVDFIAPGAFSIYRAEDDLLIYKPSQYATGDYTIMYTPEKNILKITPGYSFYENKLEPNTKYYVTMGEGFVRFKDGSTNQEIKKGDWSFTTVTAEAIPVSITYASALGSDATYSGLTFHDDWFFKDSSIYNHDLAKMSLGLAMSGFGSKKLLGYRDINVRNLFANLNFDMKTYKSYGYQEGDKGGEENTIAMALCQKDIYDKNGNKVILLGICLRGGEYGDSGWAGNVTVGYNTEVGIYHKGFYQAAVNARKEIAKYISNLDTDNVRVWLTGFSRSAAVANLLSAQLRINGLFNGSDIYTYTFATPNNQEISFNNYNNIFNLINPNDIVPTVPPKQWTFGKPGVSYFLPSMTEGIAKTEYCDRVRAQFSSIVNGRAQYNTKGNVQSTLTWLNYTISDAVPNRYLYTKYLEANLVKYYSSGDLIAALEPFLYGTSTYKDLEIAINNVKKDMNAANIFRLASIVKKALDASPYDSPLRPLLSAVYKVLTGAASEYAANMKKGLTNVGILWGMIDIASNGANSSSLMEHWPEVYLAWMTSIEEEDLTRTDVFTSKVGIVRCPIDVNIYNGEDVLVAKIINDTVQEIEESHVSVAVIGESDKVFVLPNDQSYSVELVATDDGIMDYSIMESTADGTALRTVEFEDIALNSGDLFTGTMDNKSFTNVTNYALTKNGGETIIFADYDSFKDTPTPDIPGTSDTADTYYISIPTFPNGAITPTTRNASPDDRVTLYAHPDAGYELDTLTVTDIRGRNIPLRSLGDNAYSFLMPAARVTVDASFVKVADNTPTTPAEDEIFTGLGTPGISGIVLNPAVIPFTDVQPQDWFYDNVDYVWKHYLMSGVTETQFSPNVTTSRAMIWTILARMNNVKANGTGSLWYEKGLLWAKERGVTDGTDPMGDITREQLATMLWRNAGRPAPGAAADLSRFSDSGTVSEYAQTAVRWAASVGILNGSDGRIDPQGTATRAQVAAMVARYGDRIA